MPESSPRVVKLRPLEINDAETLASWANDAEFCRDADWSLDLPYDRYLSHWRKLITTAPSDLIRLAAVCDGLLVGYTDLHGEESERRELGFVIGARDSWGHGLGRQAAAAALDHGFRKMGLIEIWAEAFDANERSVRLLQRLEMREMSRGEEGRFRGQPTFYRRFAISASEWGEHRRNVRGPAGNDR